MERKKWRKNIKKRIKKPATLCLAFDWNTFTTHTQIILISKYSLVVSFPVHIRFMFMFCLWDTFFFIIVVVGLIAFHYDLDVISIGVLLPSTTTTKILRVFQFFFFSYFLFRFFHKLYKAVSQPNIIGHRNQPNTILIWYI